MAASDVVTEDQLQNAVADLLVQIVANRDSGLIELDIGSDSTVARTAGSATQYWKCNNGTTPDNDIEGDLIYIRPA